MTTEEKKDGVPEIVKALFGGLLGAILGAAIAAVDSYLFSMTGIPLAISFVVGIIGGAVLGFRFHGLARDLFQIFS